MTLDPVMAVIMRNIAREHNALKAEIRDIKNTHPVYQRGSVQSVSLADGTAVVQRRGVDTNPLEFLPPYIPLVNDDVMLLQMGTDMVIMGPLKMDVSWHSASYLNGWGSYGSGYADARWQRTADAGIRVQGLIAGGTDGQAAFVLPHGPLQRQVYDSATQGSGVPTIGRVDVLTDGSVVPNIGGADYVSLQLWFSLY